jgi:Ca2+-binding EF-hand superfamily protein
MRLFMATLALGAVATFSLITSRADDRNAQPGQKAQPAGQPGQPGQANNAPQFQVEQFIKDHDTNKDGKLSKDELPQQMQAGFADIDTNKDGFITADELRRHADGLAHRRPEVVEVLYWVIDVPEQHALSAQELQGAYDALRKIDKNGDGKISEQELQQCRAERMKERADHMFEMMDRNKDGKISKDEARGLWARDFDKLDANKDGSLDRTEVEKALTPAAPTAANGTGRPGAPDNGGKPNK